MLKKIFIRGLIAVLPLTLTIGLCLWLLHSLEDFFGSLLRSILPPNTYFTGLGILVGILLIFCIGILMQAWVVNKLYSWMDHLIRRIPFIKIIYNAFADVMQFLDNKNHNTRRAVIVDLPEGRAVGFITADTEEGMPPGLLQKDEVLVYIPLSYQMGGQTLALPRSRVHPFDWTADKTMSFVITAGLAGKASSSTEP